MSNLSGKLTRKVISAARRSRISSSIELAVVFGFAAWLGVDLLYLDPTEAPLNPDFMVSIQSHRFWELLVECGRCALWNSQSQGGFPAFADYSGSGFHPIIGIVTIGWGLLVGAKFAIVIALAIAGFSQWWLAKELGLKPGVRVWSAVLVVSGGHLAGRMQGGDFPILFSTAMCSLMIPGMVRLAKRDDDTSVVLLGLLFASSLLSGGGHIQFGLLVLIPGMLILALTDHGYDGERMGKFVLSLVIGFMLASPVLVPLVNFAPNVEPLSPSESGIQALEYIPLNLVVRDQVFQKANVLGRLETSSQYIAYIGWVPLLLAAFGCFHLCDHFKRRIAFFLLAGFLGAILLSSDLPWRKLLDQLPISEALQQPGYILGLAVPLLAGLAALGADALLDGGIKPILIGDEKYHVRVNLVAIALILPMVACVVQNLLESKTYLTTRFLTREVDWTVAALQTDQNAWVSTPALESTFIAPGLSSDLKLTSTALDWGWNGREAPPASRIASREHVADGVLIHPREEDGGISIFRRTNVYYAMIETGTGAGECRARGLGGEIEVNCINDQPGTLTVFENNFTGWRASRDGERVELQRSRWLSVEAPAGPHDYVFKYVPGDVLVGLTLSAGALLLIAALMASKAAGRRAVQG